MSLICSFVYLEVVVVWLSYGRRLSEENFVFSDSYSLDQSSAGLVRLCVDLLVNSSCSMSSTPQMEGVSNPNFTS